MESPDSTRLKIQKKRIYILLETSFPLVEAQHPLPRLLRCQRIGSETDRQGHPHQPLHHRVRNRRSPQNWQKRVLQSDIQVQAEEVFLEYLFLLPTGLLQVEGKPQEQQKKEKLKNQQKQNPQEIPKKQILGQLLEWNQRNLIQGGKIRHQHQRNSDEQGGRRYHDLLGLNFWKRQLILWAKGPRLRENPKHSSHLSNPCYPLWKLCLRYCHWAERCRYRYRRQDFILLLTSKFNEIENWRGSWTTLWNLFQLFLDFRHQTHL